jgi:hypothetical protein
MKGKSGLLLSLALIASAVFLVGCLHNEHRTNESKGYIDGQLSAIEKQKPIFELEAQEGQQITLGGVKALRVFAPKDTSIRALPQQRSAWADFGLKLVDGGMKVAGYKLASDTLTSIFNKYGDSAGDHSVTNITDSYNDSSDNSAHGDTITDSNLIGGDVTGPGAGIGNDLDASTDVSGDGSVAGNDNEVINGNNANNSGEIRDNDSDGPFDDHSDHSDDGDDCTGDDCGDEIVPPPEEDGT